MPADPGFRLYAVTDRTLVAGRPLAEHLEGLCAAGLRAVQLREKDLGETELAVLAGGLVPPLARLGARIFVNGSVAAAGAAGAAGVHLPASGEVAPARAALGPGRAVGKSVHSAAEAKRAGLEGADFLVFGPVFDTPSKRAFGPPQGIERLREVCEITGVPVFAVGGVTPARVVECLRAGAHGVAALSPLMAGGNPLEVLREYGRELGGF